MFRWLLRWFSEPPKLKLTDSTLCESCVAQLKITSPTKLTIRGVEYTFTGSKYCPECTRAYHEQFATMCAECGGPILVSEPVADAGNLDGSLVHNTMECSVPGAFCGHWGETGVIPYVG